MRPSGKERRAYRAAESRVRESIALRDVLPYHTYPDRERDLELMRAYHQAYGVPDVGLMARVKRLVGPKKREEEDEPKPA
jgi:hypothetical protein